MNKYYIGQTIRTLKDANYNNIKKGAVGIIINKITYVTDAYVIQFNDGNVSSWYGTSIEPYTTDKLVLAMLEVIR